MDFGAIIMSWYVKNKRDLPWRKTQNPYKIWLSEIILQQTRVQQGLPYYFSFINKYPDVKSLAGAAEDDILKLWQGLGYYSRARNLHSAAKMVVNDFNGVFPATYIELKKLKGVGDYTAAAISSICYNEVQAVVDGNVYRVLSRIYGIDTPIDSTEGKKLFNDLANSLISEKHPADFNQSIMEFGAIQCVPKNPACEICPFFLHCEARKKDLINVLPVKSKKTKVTDRFFNYLVLHHKGTIYLKQRSGNDIWKGLFDFPLIETDTPVNEKQLMRNKEWGALFKDSSAAAYKIQNYSEEIKHILSHQRLHVRFVEIHLEKKMNVKEWLSVKEEELKKFAVPVVIANYIASRK
ncbi:MAG: A/G-specific adenine glycosylase [Bacteroidia bacterium]